MVQLGQSIRGSYLGQLLPAHGEVPHTPHSHELPSVTGHVQAVSALIALYGFRCIRGGRRPWLATPCMLHARSGCRGAAAQEANATYVRSTKMGRTLDSSRALLYGILGDTDARAEL